MKKSFVFFVLFSLLTISQTLLAQNAQTDVISYNITLDVNHLQTGRHIGFTELCFKILESNSNLLEFDLKNQDLDSVVYNSQSIDFSYQDDKILIEMPQGVSSEDTLSFRFYYSGGNNMEPMGWGGMHYSGRIIYSMGVAFEDYPHSYGRSWFVCKDDFADKASFEFHISVPKDVTAVCGGVLEGVSRHEDYDTYHWKIEQQISPYLASVTIADFDTMEQTLQSVNGEVPLQVHYFTADSLNVRRSFENFPLAFAKLEECFGPFPFNRAGYCTTPLGSMEHVDNISLMDLCARDFSVSNQSVIVHEFAHSWFGNLMTCATSFDMWLNEGWTTFTERISLEAMYGEDCAKEYFRAKKKKVLQQLPLQEGVFALHGVDSTRTYSSTVYDKGALVALSLKAYMGDSMFYESVRKLLSDFSFSNIDSHTMRDSLSSYSNIDLGEFFDFYVFDTIIHHFALSDVEFGEKEASFVLDIRTSSEDSADISNVRIPVTFMDSAYNTYKCLIKDDGSRMPHRFELPFNPVAAFLDSDEEFLDLTTDSYKMITKDSLYKYEDSYFRADVHSLQDSCLLRVTLHWLGSMENEMMEGVTRFSRKHYWTVEGVNLDHAEMDAKFYFDISTQASAFDNTLCTSFLSKDSLMLFYRPDARFDWQLVDCSIPNTSSGYVSARLVPGDYIMAVGDREKVGLESRENKTERLKIYPNPSNGRIRVEHPLLHTFSKAKIYDLSGRLVRTETFHSSENCVDSRFELPPSAYTIVLERGTDSISQSFVIGKDK